MNDLTIFLLCVIAGWLIGTLAAKFYENEQL